MKKNVKNYKKINKQKQTKKIIKKNLGCQMDIKETNLDHEMEKR